MAISNLTHTKHWRYKLDEKGRLRQKIKKKIKNWLNKKGASILFGEQKPLVIFPDTKTRDRFIKKWGL